ncbi:MAG: aminopeptidase [Bacteroidetes bacterium]|nr:aminopeptidase [Bacteroidota bacterium]
MKHALPFLLIALLILPLTSPAQDDDTSSESGYKFTMLKHLPATPVRNQYRTSTCWSFSAISMLESELLRMERGEFDLSEMFIVRNVYERKAQKYVRMHGNASFAGGGAYNDVIAILRDLGMVPDGAYPGLAYGEEKHIHGELDAVLKGYVEALIKNPNRRLTPVWDDGLAGILDAYLGAYPAQFTWKDKPYTPRSFADQVLQLDPTDYVMLSSFTHHPFYQEFVLEVPDNWDYGLVHNVPLSELMETITYAIDHGYTVAWASDVSEPGFNFKKGIAVITEKDWDEMEKSERDSVFLVPVKEKTITQELRQKAFDNYTTTDDHGMHITGVAEDQNGTKYYYVKNSWGVKNSKYDGFFYASEAFVAYKTMSILLHRDAIPPAVRSKLGLL